MAARAARSLSTTTRWVLAEAGFEADRLWDSLRMAAGEAALPTVA